MKKIGTLFGVEVYETVAIDENKIVLISPTEELKEKLKSLLLDKVLKDIEPIFKK